MHYRALFILLFITSMSASAGTPAISIIKHECSSVDATKTGFSCSVGARSMDLHWHKNPKELPKKQREGLKYQMDILVQHYFAAGGTFFNVTSSDWPKDKAKQCFATPSRQSYICRMCRGKDEHGNWLCEY